MNMRPGPSKFPRPDGKGCVPGTKVVPCSKGTNTGTCQPDVNCTLGTNPGRTHRFYAGKAVVPFGYGLSYSTFKYDPAPSATRISLEPVRSMLESTYSAGRTFPSSDLLQAADPLVAYYVNVTNTGKMDADDVVLGFMKPPGAGENGVPLQTLFAFERVHVKAGETVSVNLYPSLTDFTATQLDGTKEALAGEWTVQFGVKETFEHGQGYAELSLTTY